MLEHIRNGTTFHQIVALLAWIMMKIPGIKEPTECPKQGFFT